MEEGYYNTYEKFMKANNARCFTIEKYGKDTLWMCIGKDGNDKEYSVPIQQLLSSKFYITNMSVLKGKIPDQIFAEAVSMNSIKKFRIISVDKEHHSCVLEREDGKQGALDIRSLMNGNMCQVAGTKYITNPAELKQYVEYRISNSKKAPTRVSDENCQGYNLVQKFSNEIKKRGYSIRRLRNTDIYAICENREPIYTIIEVQEPTKGIYNLLVTIYAAHNEFTDRRTYMIKQKPYTQATEDNFLFALDNFQSWSLKESEKIVANHNQQTNT